MRYLSHTETDIQYMLMIINISSIESLLQSIPNELRLKIQMNLPIEIDEYIIKKTLETNILHPDIMCFIGAGLYRHFVPEVVAQILNRGEWLTSYTPYQAEASQGTLQTIFEFQTIVSSIYGCDVSNASLYDGATALIEAILMSVKIKAYNLIVLADNIHPEYLAVCITYSKMCNFIIIKIPFNIISGQIDFDFLRNILKKKKAAAVVYQIPNFLGILEYQQKIINIAHNYNSLIIVANLDPLVFALVQNPGTLNADIVIGEGIGLCSFTGLGSPGLGLLGIRKKFLRYLPGRLVGMTKDKNSRRSFVLTLATREQHIRRSRATSNICTNNNLNALAFLITLSLYGKKGYYNIAKQNILKSIYFKKSLESKKTISIKYTNNFFNEIIIEFKNKQFFIAFLKKMQLLKIMPGFILYHFFSKFNYHLLICITELHCIKDINLLIKEIY